MNLFVTFSLSMVWGLINGLQIVSYFMLFNITIPGNIFAVNNILYKLATFDLIPLDWLTDYLDDITEEYDNNKSVDLSN